VCNAFGVENAEVSSGGAGSDWFVAAGAGAKVRKGFTPKALHSRAQASRSVAWVVAGRAIGLR
jgi:hypothetical protein